MKSERILSFEEWLLFVSAARYGCSLVPSPAFSEGAVEHSQTRTNVPSSLIFTFQNCEILNMCMSVVHIFQIDH